MTPSLETDRLLLVPRSLEDIEQIQQRFPVWDIVRYMTAAIPWPYPPGDSARYFVEKVGPAMERGDEWHWTLRPRSQPGEIIGVISLFRNENNNRGFWIMPEWQGQGLMTEAVQTVTDFWFGELGFERLRAYKAVANVASRRISERMGMRVIATEDRDYVCGRLPSELWEITADEWRAYRSRAKSLPGSPPRP